MYHSTLGLRVTKEGGKDQGVGGVEREDEGWLERLLSDQTRDRCLREREFFIDNLLVRIHLIVVMIRWTGLAPWEIACESTYE